MALFEDVLGNRVRLTDERAAHILEHPEMAGQIDKIGETLLEPERIVQSRSDEEARLYYRWYDEILDGKYLCVVVEYSAAGGFIVTAYFTDKIKKGEIVWQK